MPIARLCDDLGEGDYALIEPLLDIAVEQGQLDVLGQWIGLAYSNERLRQFLTDTAALAAFRARAMAGLARGVQQCHSASFSILAKLHAEGLFAPKDPVLAAAYELVRTWQAEYRPNGSAPLLEERLEALSNEQAIRAVAFARQTYEAACR